MQFHKTQLLILNSLRCFFKLILLYGMKQAPRSQEPLFSLAPTFPYALGDLAHPTDTVYRSGSCLVALSTNTELRIE